MIRCIARGPLRRGQLRPGPLRGCRSDGAAPPGAALPGAGPAGAATQGEMYSACGGALYEPGVLEDLHRLLRGGVQAVLGRLLVGQDGFNFSP